MNWGWNYWIWQNYISDGNNISDYDLMLHVHDKIVFGKVRAPYRMRLQDFLLCKGWLL